MSAMITVEEALSRVLASAETPLEEEKVALPSAYGRMLARDIKALRTQPPFPNSAMDGYARARGRHGVAARDPDGRRQIRRRPRLRRRRRSGPGGAHLHRRADAGRRRRHRHSGGRRAARACAFVSRPPRRPATICVRPAWIFAQGEALIAAGRRLTPRDVALAAAANHTALRVRRRARVAILATGDELVPPGGALGPRRSSPPTISPSPGWSRRAGASRSTSASRSTRSAR